MLRRVDDIRLALDFRSAVLVRSYYEFECRVGLDIGVVKTYVNVCRSESRNVDGGRASSVRVYCTFTRTRFMPASRWWHITDVWT